MRPTLTTTTTMTAMSIALTLMLLSPTWYGLSPGLKFDSVRTLEIAASML